MLRSFSSYFNDVISKIDSPFYPSDFRSYYIHIRLSIYIMLAVKVLVAWFAKVTCNLISPNQCVFVEGVTDINDFAKQVLETDYALFLRSILTVG